MKIAMIGQKGLATGERTGGIERHVAEVSKRLVESGHSVFVYSRSKYMPAKPKTWQGVDLVFIPTIYRKNLEAIIYTFLATIHAVSGDYDVIHYHGVGPSTLSWIARLFSRSTVIVTFHSQDRYHQKWGFLAKFYLYLGEWTAVLFSHYCIVVSHDMQVYIRDHLHKEAVYIPNGAELKGVQGSSTIVQFGLSPKSYLLNVGRIVPQKGLHILIDAYKCLNTSKQLVIVGAPSFSDAYYVALRKQSEDDKRIHFLGFQEGQTLDELFANAYLYVHPSESEGLPLVILEAMSFGVAPLVSNIEPNLEAIHGAGFAFESGNVEDLTFQLDYLLTRQIAVDQIAQEAQEIVETFFSWKIITDHIESVYITARH